MILSGKTALVTGASRGIGAATAKILAEYGASVAVNYNSSEKKANDIVQSINEKNGKAVAIKANVFEKDQSENMVAEAIKQLGKIDVLVLNAGSTFKNAPFMEQSWEDFEFKVNNELKGSIFAIKAVLPHMLERKSGSIIIITSVLSRTPGYGFSTHTTAKSALDGLAKSLAFELGPSGIRVNVIAPGLTLTDATSNIPPEGIEAAARMTPMKRVGQPEDVAGAILLYAMDGSQFITGNYTPVNGGSMML